MADFKVTKGCVVEVSSDEPGFHGAWYVATVMDVVDPPSSTKTQSNKKTASKKTTTTSGYLVKYDTLFQENKLDEQLCEVVEAAYVRPLPPRYPRRIRENDNVAQEGDDQSGGLDFEVGDVIDAFHRDGWWLGVVKEKLVDDNNKFIVSFENPPEEFEFKASQLRFHVDWVDSHWKFPLKKNNKQELGDKNAAHTSESNTNTTDAHSGFTTPVKGPKTTDLNNQTICGRLASLRRTSSRKKAETTPRMLGSVSNNRKKRSMSSVEEDSYGKRPQSSAAGKRNKKLVMSGTETSGSEAIQQDSLLVEQETTITETCDKEEGSSSLKRKRGNSPMLQVEKPNGSQQDNQEACNGDSSALDEVTTDIDEQPLSTWVHGLHPLSVLKRRSCSSPPDQHDESSVAVNQAVVNENKQDWPFIKRSPIWNTIESLESYQTPVQKPHFSPLKKVNENYREGFAIGYMVTFANMVEDISKIQLSDPLNMIDKRFETLANLENHGFNVDSIRARLNEFVTWKVKVCQLKDTLKKVENDLEKHSLEKTTIEEEMSQLEVKMVELKGKMVQAEIVKNLKDEELKRLQSNLDLVSKEIKKWALAFERLAANPL